MRPKLFFAFLIFIALSGCKSAQIPNNSFIHGPWYGKAYQFDMDEKWPLAFYYDAKRKVFYIEYPTLECGGEWTLIRQNGDVFEFRETINEGLDICTDQGKVILKKINDETMVFLYFWPNDEELSASGVLKKQTKVYEFSGFDIYY